MTRTRWLAPAIKPKQDAAMLLREGRVTIEELGEVSVEPGEDQTTNGAEQE